MDLKRWIRTVPDYPSEGIFFRDITPLLANPTAFKYAVTRISELYQHRSLDAIVAIDARGFLFGAPVALNLSLPFIPFRKPDKLPPKVVGINYQLEYGSARLEARSNSLATGMNVLVIDDLLATGGTALAATRLIEHPGANINALAFIIELVDLNGRSTLNAYDITSIIKY